MLITTHLTYDAVQYRQQEPSESSASSLYGRCVIGHKGGKFVAYCGFDNIHPRLYSIAQTSVSVIRHALQMK